MKKSLAAAAALLLLLGAALWNIRYVDSITDRMIQAAERSRTLLLQNAPADAAKALEEAAELWIGAEGYSHIFLRHAEVDAISDAFFELLSMLESEDPRGADAAFERLEYHLRSLDKMEHITWQSVF